MIEVNDFQRDVLREMVSIAGNKGLTALSEQLLNEEMTVNIPQILFLQIDRISKSIPVKIREESEMTIVTDSPLVGDFKGDLLIMFPRDTAIFLTNLVRKVNASNKRNFDIRLLKRIAGIVSEEYLEVVRGFTDSEISFSEIFMITTYGRSIVDTYLSTVGLDVKGSFLIMAIVSFHISGYEDKECTIAFTLGIESLTKMLEKINEKYPVIRR